MIFVFHVYAFNDVMTFDYPKSRNLIISRPKRAFELKQKKFLVSKLLSSKNTKETSKNVAKLILKY